MLKALLLLANGVALLCGGLGEIIDNVICSGCDLFIMGSIQLLLYVFFIGTVREADDEFFGWDV